MHSVKPTKWQKHFMFYKVTVNLLCFLKNQQSQFPYHSKQTSDHHRKLSCRWAVSATWYAYRWWYRFHSLAFIRLIRQSLAHHNDRNMSFIHEVTQTDVGSTQLLYNDAQAEIGRCVVIAPKLPSISLACPTQRSSLAKSLWCNAW